MGPVVEQGAEPEQRVYRVFSHHGDHKKLETGGGKRECRYLDSAIDAEHVYCLLHQSFGSPPHTLTPSPLTDFPPSLGSPLLQKVSP